MDDVVVQYVARYGGARPCKHLNTRTASLNVIRFRTGNQCNSRSYVDVHVVAGIMVVIGRFQWVGVMDHTTSTQLTSQSDVTSAAAAAAADDDDDDDKAESSPRMQYFIQVLLY